MKQSRYVQWVTSPRFFYSVPKVVPDLLKVLLISIVLMLLGSAQAQVPAAAAKSFMAADRVAVFYPSNFDSIGTLPSFIFKRPLIPKAAVPGQWSVVPSFSFENGRNVVRFAYNGVVDFYGNGEVTGPLRRNGTEVTLWNTDSPAFGVDGGKRLYQSHPWIMGVRADGTAFGIIADNSWKQYFSISNPVMISSEGPGFRVVVIESSSAEELVKILSDLTGKMDLPALWTLGFQQSRFSYTPASRVRNIADEFRNRKIPCDVIWMDIDYMDQYKVFTFNPGGFSDPRGLNDYLHSKKFKSVYMIDPGVKSEPGYFVYDQGSAGDHWVKKSDGTEFKGQVWPPVVSFPDFTRPQTRSWWSSLYGNFMATGMDGVWNDMNEPSVFATPNGTMPESNLHRGGGDLPAGTHARYHNVYGYLMVKASREGIVAANPAKRPFVLSRSNFLGGQQYAATWTGDNSSTWAHLKMSIPMSITLGLSGQPVSGPDIGGFTSNCTADLLGHWMAIGAYYPFSRNHTIAGSVDQEPWAYGAEIENVSRTAINRRYRLMPYLYSLFREASESGMPIMRPVFFGDHADVRLRNEQQAFLLGKNLLVVPKWAENPALPKGDWDRLPLESTEDRYQATLFVRPGAVIPLGNLIQSTVDYKSDSITLLMNPTELGTASGGLYYDDGEGYAYKSNNFAQHEFVVSKHNADSLKLSINQIAGTKNIARVYRVGYVTDGEVVYLPWSSSAVRYISIIPDATPSIDLSALNSMNLLANFTSGFVPMKLIDEKKWKLDSNYFQVGQTYSFRFSQSNSEETGLKWGSATGLSGNVSLVSNALATVSFTVPSAGYYSISFDQTSLRYVVQKTPAINSLAIVGDATFPLSWDQVGLPMQQSAEDLNVFTWTGTLLSSNGNTEGKFKFHYGTGSSCEDVWIYASVADQALSASSLVIANGCSVPDRKWKVNPGENGTYKITINVALRTISIKKMPSIMAIVGDATSIGWNTNGLAMQQAPDRANIFTWTGNLNASNGTTEGKFKFHSGTNGFCDDTWLYATVSDQSLSASSLVMANGCSVPDNKWIVRRGESGNYKITVDVDAKKISFQRIISSLSIVGDATSIGWNTQGLPFQRSSEDPNVFTWTGTLSASNGTTEGAFKFHSGTNGFCDDTWLYAVVANQSLSATSLVLATGCTVPDNKWKVKPSESGIYKITVDVSKKIVRFQKELTTLAIVGDATSAGWNTLGLSMQRSSENPNVFTWIGTLSASNGTTEGAFKFHSGTGGFCNDTWLYAAVPNQSLSSSALVMANGCTAPDYKWKLNATESGTYKISVNVETNKISIQRIFLNTLSIVGDATSIGWNTQGLSMLRSAENANVFTWTGTLSESNGTSQGKFKFHSGTNGWCDDIWLYASITDQSLSGKSFVMAPGCSVPDTKWKVAAGESGTYKISVDVATNVIKIEKVLLPSLAIVGDATSIGWNPLGLAMQQSADDPNVFRWVGTLSASNGTSEGRFKFHSGTTNSWCGDTWLYASTPNQSLTANTFIQAPGCSVGDNKWKVQLGESSTYQVSVNVATQRIEIKNIAAIKISSLTEERQLESSMETFPNPVEEFLMIRFSDLSETPTEIALYDMSGDKLLVLNDRTILDSGEIRLPMSEIHPGLYILKVEKADGVMIRMIMK